MLTREVMGLFVLGVLWLNAGLVLAVALRRLVNLSALRARLRRARDEGRLVRGTVSGPDGPVAVRRIHQIGRAVTTRGPERILFTDGPQSFEVRAASLRVGDRVLEVQEARPGESEVWLSPERVEEGMACPSAAAFDEAWEAGSRFKGHAREVELEVRDGDEVWVLGERDGESLRGGSEQPLVVSMLDPEAWAAGRARLTWLFLFAATAALAGVTALALWPPHFGPVSTAGAVLGVAYFLAIQPLGTRLGEAVETPARRLEGALWTRPRAEAQDAALPPASGT